MDKPKTWTLEIKPKALKGLERIDPISRARIRAFLDDRILTSSNPRSLGQAMKGEWKEFWRYRVGDYRVVCDINDHTVTVLVVDVGHRSSIYDRRS